MAYTLPSGTTAVPRQKILATRWNNAFNSIAACLNTKRDLAALVETQYGGLNVNAAAKSGLVHFSNGVVAFESGTIFVDAAGADPTGVRDSSSVVQALINLGYRKLIFNPEGVYRFTAKVTVPPLTAGNLTDSGREIDWNGCRIVAANGITNCFEFTDAVWPNNHRHGTYHNVIFDGTCTGAFILCTGGYAWYNHFSRLRATATASATALLQIHNTLASSQPGGWEIHNLVSSCPATLLLSMETTAAPQFDDFLITHIFGGSVAAGSGSIVISPGCVLTDSLVQSVFSGGRHGINALGGYLQKCIVQRLLVEIPPEADFPGAAVDANYGIVGTLDDCTIDTIHMNFPRVSKVGAPDPYLPGLVADGCNPGVCCARVVANNSRFTNLTMNATAQAIIPYAGPPSHPYPALNLLGGKNNTFDFPKEYLENGVLHGGTSACENICYLGGALEKEINFTSDLDPWYCRGGVINNWGQGAVAAVITLPKAAAGLSVTFNMIGNGGGAYSVKPFPGDKIILNQTPLDDGDKITCAVPSLGNSVTLRAVRSGAEVAVEWYYDWHAVTTGTWVDGGA